MRNECDGAGHQSVDLEGRTRGERDAVGDIDEADRIRPKKPHIAGSAFQPLLSHHSFRAALAKSAGENDRRARSDVSQIPDRIRDPARADQNDGGVWCMGQRPDIRKAWIAPNRLMARVDQEDFMPVAIFFQRRRADGRSVWPHRLEAPIIATLFGRIKRSSASISVLLARGFVEECRNGFPVFGGRVADGLGFPAERKDLLFRRFKCAVHDALGESDRRERTPTEIARPCGGVMHQRRGRMHAIRQCQSKELRSNPRNGR